MIHWQTLALIYGIGICYLMILECLIRYLVDRVYQDHDYPSLWFAVTGAFLWPVTAPWITTVMVLQLYRAYKRGKQ